MPLRCADAPLWSSRHQSQLALLVRYVQTTTLSAMQRPPLIDGVGASRFQLRPGPWATVLQALAAQFPAIGHEVWLQRFARGRVLDDKGVALAAETAFRVGAEIFYYREVDTEARLPGGETVLHVDADLVVVDKPHLLPVIPGGGYVSETLLTRVRRRFGNADPVPLHRIDRLTAGLVLFSINPATRGAYQALFRTHAIDKYYEALAAPLAELHFPVQRESHLVRGEPFFRMRESEGAPNSLSRMDVIERGATTWRYALQPVTGRKHQLRVHMAALGAPILHDPLYPQLTDPLIDDPARPLKLLARALAFVDPLNGRARRFESRLSL